MLTNEYREGNLAVKETKVTFFCIPIFKKRKTSTNNIAVAALTVESQRFKIKGFNNEVENKSKKNKQKH